MKISGNASPTAAIAPNVGTAVRVNRTKSKAGITTAQAKAALSGARMTPRSADYIATKLDPAMRDHVFKSDALVNTLAAQGYNPKPPAKAIVIKDASAASLRKLETGAGKTFVLRGDIKLPRAIKLPSNVTVFVDGNLTRTGKFQPANGTSTNTWDAFFIVSGKKNVRLQGINGATLSSNGRATGVIVNGSNSVGIRGLTMKDVWEGVSVSGKSNFVVVEHNSIANTAQHGVNIADSTQGLVARNVIENAGRDAITFSGVSDSGIAFENLLVGWRANAIGTKRGARNTWVAKNVAVMAEFGYAHPDKSVAPDTSFTMGIADFGSSKWDKRITAKNQFFDNTVWKPAVYDRTNSTEANYFAKRQDGKGKTFFFGNGGNVGTAAGTVADVADKKGAANDFWNNVDTTNEGLRDRRVAALEAQFDLARFLKPAARPAPQPAPKLAPKPAPELAPKLGSKSAPKPAPERVATVKPVKVKQITPAKDLAKLPARVVSAQIEFGREPASLEVFDPKTGKWKFVANSAGGKRGIYKLPAAAGKLPVLQMKKNRVHYYSTQPHVAKVTTQDGKTVIQMGSDSLRGKGNVLWNPHNDLKVTLGTTKLSGPTFAETLNYPVPSTPAVALNRLKAAPVSAAVKTYLSNSIDPDIRARVLTSDAMVNTLKGISHKPKPPKTAIVLDKIDGAARWELKNGKGRTYVIKGNHTVTKPIEIGSGVTVYVGGKLHMNGTFVAKSNQHENREQTILLVKGAKDVKIIGTDGGSLTSNRKANGIIATQSSNVTVRNMDIHNVWQGVDLTVNVNGGLIQHNYVKNAGRRAFWSLYQANDISYVQNFIENAGWDSIDLDAYVYRNKAFENVFVGWGRWALFTEEGAQDNIIAKNVGVMSDVPWSRKSYSMGLADNGSTNLIKQPTKNNRFISNDIWRPAVYTKPNSDGAYFAGQKDQSAQNYFWNNGGNVGHTFAGRRDLPDAGPFPRRDLWHTAGFTMAPWGRKEIAALEKRYPGRP